MIDVHRINAFTTEHGGGNPAGVVFDYALSESTMQRVAEKVGDSETVFITPRKQGYRLTYYTPTQRVRLCGHATIAAIGWLRANGHISDGPLRLFTDAGEIAGRCEGTMNFLSVPIHSLEPLNSPRVAEMLGFSVIDAHIIDTGVREVYVRVDALSDLTPSLRATGDLASAHACAGVYLYAYSSPTRTLTARNFLTPIGIDEESATGTAAGGVGYLLTKDAPTARGLTIHQGLTMANPSTLYVRPRINEAVSDVGGTIGFIETINVL